MPVWHCPHGVRRGERELFMKAAEVDRIVAAIDETRRTENFRDHDGRPDTRTFRLRSTGVPPEIVRAQARCRTAAWRIRNDARRAPDTHTIGMAMLHALVTSRLSEMTHMDRDLVSRMLTDLQARGFSITETRNVLRRMRNRYVDPGDREGEPTATTGKPLRLTREPDDDLPF